jgi:biopolymer transport protein ExbB
LLDLVQAGGWMMIPIILCSVIAAAIAVERVWSLQPGRIAPRTLLAQVWGYVKKNELDRERLREIRNGSALGQIFAAGLGNARHGRVIMKEAMEEEASVVMHELERYLTALGTIASVSPLLGLLGTVVGMIKAFTVLMAQGAGNANNLAGGISTALITTAGGLCVAIPSLMFYRFFLRRVDDLIITPDKSVSYAIIGAGGFLGMGKHDVAIPVGQFKEDKGRFVLAGATKDALKAMPKFEYAK